MASQTSAFALNSFHDYFKKWIAEQKHHLMQLISATKSSSSLAATSTRDKYSLVSQVITHYEEYYRVKSHWAGKDVLVMLSPPWRTQLEVPFQWIGGWRPTMAFHLLYSKSGLQLESWLVIQASSDTKTNTSSTSAIPPDDLSNLGTYQLRLVNQLQAKTVEEERKITEKMAKHQETIADLEMVKLTHEVTMFMGGEGGKGFDEDGDEKIELTLESKEEGMKKILTSADDLRLRTLKGVIKILSPNQALHFLIAAAELHLRLHEWGKQHNDSKLN